MQSFKNRIDEVRVLSFTEELHRGTLHHFATEVSVDNVHRINYTPFRHGGGYMQSTQNKLYTVLPWRWMYAVYTK